MSEGGVSELFPKHPEVTREMDVIPASSGTKQRLLDSITERVPKPKVATLPSKGIIPENRGANLESETMKYRVSLFPLGNRENGAVASVLYQKKDTPYATTPTTQYTIKENPDPDSQDSLIVEKTILPPPGEREATHPPSEWYLENGAREGIMTDHLNRTFNKADAETVRETMGGVTLDQMGDPLQVNEGELRDLIKNIAAAK